MNWLFIHQNFPGQYVHVARHLAQIGDRVVFITQERGSDIAGVRKVEYAPDHPAPGTHEYLHDTEAGIRNGLSVARQCELPDWDGVVPHLVLCHNGWGEILYVKEVWPDVPRPR